MSSQREVEEIRRRLSVLADTIPDHGLSDFGQLVEIEAVQGHCVYRVTLETDCEERTLLKREKPDDGSIAGLTDQAAVGLEVDVWDATWDSLVTNKQHGTYEYGIPGSTKTGRCRPCRGRGAFQCETCDGQGILRCSRCQGGWEWCSGCSGKGVRWEKGLGRRKRECFNSTHGPWCCNGKGWYYDPHEETYEETCRRCGGKGQHKCTRCNGTTTVTCENCRGGGRLVCPTCQGKKRVVSWLAIQQTIKRQTENARCGSTGLTEEDRRQLTPSAPDQPDDFDQADYDVALGCEVPSPGSDRLPPELEHCAFPPELRASVEGLLAAKGKAGHGRRILRQSLRIEEAKVLAVTYKYAAKEYGCRLVGKAKTLAETNPLTELSQARQRLPALKKKLRRVDSFAWLDSTKLGRVLTNLLVGLALLACVLFVPIGICVTWRLAWTVLAGGWGLLFSYAVLAACLYPLLADKKKVQEWVDRQNAPLVAEIQALESEVERLLRPDRERQAEACRQTNCKDG